MGTNEHDLGKDEHELDRRGFLRGAGLAGLGALGLGVLSACSPPASGGEATGGGSDAGGANDAGDTDVAWDEEVDVLVVGSGTAAFAALVAKGNGAARVMVIEKSDMWGGTSATSGGTLWIPLFFAGQDAGMADTREDAVEYMRLCADGRGNDAAIEAYVDNANALCEWTRDTYDWDWVTDTPGAGFKDYYEPFTGFRAQGRQASLGNGGAGMWASLQEVLGDIGVEVLMETAATELVVDESGAVIGVQAESAGAPLAIKANTCVVLGTGGFDHNPELVHAFQSIPIYVTNAAVGNTGDAHLMGNAIGAALGNMDTNWGLPSFLPEPFDAHADAFFDISLPDWGIYRAGAGSLIVNQSGRRFANESSAYAVFNRAFGNYSTETPGWANTPAVWICDSNYFASGGNMLPGMSAPEDPLPATFFTADSLAEIAEHFDIDAAALEAEVAAFNTNAEQGTDPVFHRGEKSVDRCIGAYHPYLSELANPVLAPVATAPFYAALYVPGTCGTNGGLKINEHAQVLDTNGEVIPGLLAVGNCTAGITGGQYCGAGMTLGSGAVMSYIGIRKALGIA
ncbi:MAG: FAD-binding protein [Coriobacteriales bacterium]|jgi:succinate dehydrogenase/fumarate reductase flavoprotein subunit|nr:FAD-binding protein [Coriobacteriales bacterium]